MSVTSFTLCLLYTSAAGLVNLLQLAGRIRRNEEDCYNDSVVWSIELDFSGLLKSCLLYTSIQRLLIPGFQLSVLSAYIENRF